VNEKSQYPEPDLARPDATDDNAINDVSSNTGRSIHHVSKALFPHNVNRKVQIGIAAHSMDSKINGNL
jgi:hypothetical protein